LLNEFARKGYIPVARRPEPVSATRAGHPTVVQRGYRADDALGFAPDLLPCRRVLSRVRQPRRWFGVEEESMPPIFDPAFRNDAFNLVIAVLLGGAIGFERQWRQRLAGLRTNTLVSLGAAIFVVFESQFTETSPTRVAAQVVTGIGFLGAGVIWKEGVNVRGLNTAATLWCSCAVGLLAGAGFWSRAILAAGLVAGVNLVLRPLVTLINRQPLETAEIETSYIVTVTCRAHEEAQIRALLVQGFGVSDLHLRELESTDIEGTDRVAVNATLTSEKRREIALEYIVGRLSLEPSVTAARWRTVNTIV
jgi:putative Mg2+ transporter-C (MgtC) family protein